MSRSLLHGLDAVSFSHRESKPATASDCAGSSVAHHLLGSYQRSLLAILLAQFTKKRFSGGMAGVVRLATKSITVQVGRLSYEFNPSFQL